MQAFFQKKMGWKVQVVDGGLSDMYNTSHLLADDEVSSSRCILLHMWRWTPLCISARGSNTVMCRQRELFLTEWLVTLIVECFWVMWSPIELSTVPILRCGYSLHVRYLSFGR